MMLRPSPVASMAGRPPWKVTIVFDGCLAEAVNIAGRRGAREDGVAIPAQRDGPGLKYVPWR